MPRVYVRGEIGTTGTFEDIEFYTDDESSVRSAVSFAVEVEHPCTDNRCDIGMALEWGYPLAAAHLLQGATETPFLDAVLEKAFPRDNDYYMQEWDNWVEVFKEETVECKGCGSYVKRDTGCCGNCGGEIYGND